MKPNEKVNTSPKEKTVANQFLDELLKDIIRTVGIPPAIDYTNPKVDDGVKYFFENYYIQIDTDKKEYPFDDFNLSKYEFDIIDYMRDKTKHSMPCLILGHSGVGKSTLLKYLTNYLWVNSPSLQDIFLPIYLTLSSQADQIAKITTQNKFYDLLDEMIYEKIHSLLYEYFLGNFKDILPYVTRSSHFDSLKGKYSFNKIKEIEGMGIADYLSEISELDHPIYKKLLLDTMTYYTKNKRRIILIIDDVDRLTYDIHRFCLNYLIHKINFQYAGIAALRFSTYKSIETIYENSGLNPFIEISYSEDMVRKILLSRINKSCGRIKIKLEAQKPVITNAIEIVEAFTKLMTHKDSINLLTNLSNQNLEILFRKIQLMCNSEYFDDDLIAKEILYKKTKDYDGKRYEKKIVWLIYSLVFSNYYGTFITNDEMVNCGIVNIFSSKPRTRNPFKYLIRLHLLTGFYVNGIDSWHDEKNFIALKDIYRDYCEIFGSESIFTNIFIRSIFRLVQGHLLFTFSCYPYTKEEEIRSTICNDTSNEMMITSTAGKFYLESIITIIDYLYFIKDDIDWTNSDYNIPCASTEKSFRSVICFETLEALKKLMKDEYIILQKIKNYQDDINLKWEEEIKKYQENKSAEVSKRRKEITRIYAEKFSPLKFDPGKNTVSFTHYMFDKFKYYIEHKHINLLKNKKLVQTISEIETIISDFRSLEEYFLYYGK